MILLDFLKGGSEGTRLKERIVAKSIEAVGIESGGEGLEELDKGIYLGTDKLETGEEGIGSRT